MLIIFSLFRKAVEISRVDYEPCEEDILYSEGIASNKVASLEFYFPEDRMEYIDTPLVR